MWSRARCPDRRSSSPRPSISVWPCPTSAALRAPVQAGAGPAGPVAGAVVGAAGPPRRPGRRGARRTRPLAVASGYLDTLFTQTITFAGDEFGAGNRAQGCRRQRRPGRRAGGPADHDAMPTGGGGGASSSAAATAGCVLAVTGALAPSLPWLAGSQMVARGFATAMLLLVAIVAAEEMPAGSRAYAVSLLAMAGGLGAGVCVIALRLADLGARGWRLLYVIPLAGPADRRRGGPPPAREPALRGPPRRGRHGRPRPAPAAAGRLGRPGQPVRGAPVAVRQPVPARRAGLQRRSHRAACRSRSARPPPSASWSAGASPTCGAGGWWPPSPSSAAPLCTVGVLLLAAAGRCGLVALVGTVISAAAIPALGVYGPELFPTALRGRANGLVAVSSLAGSAAGLILGGVLADRFGRIGPAMSILAVGPLLLAVLVWPPTRRRRAGSWRTSTPRTGRPNRSGTHVPDPRRRRRRASVAPPRQPVAAALDPDVGHRAGDGRRGRLQLGRRAEGVPGAGHEQAGHGQRGKCSVRSWSGRPGGCSG